MEQQIRCFRLVEGMTNFYLDLSASFLAAEVPAISPCFITCQQEALRLLSDGIEAWDLESKVMLMGDGKTFSGTIFTLLV